MELSKNKISTISYELGIRRVLMPTLATLGTKSEI